MTWTVVIADDERIQREGIVQHVPWEQMGLVLAGTAANGEEALGLIRAAPPDILVTDIKMPSMGGLELAKHARSLNPRIRIIIISGYDDFEFARTAIELSATAYLLKPLFFPDLLDILKSVAAACEEEARQEEERLDLQRQMEESKTLAMRQLLRDLLQGRLAEPDAIKASMCDAGIPAVEPFVIAVLRTEEEKTGKIEKINCETLLAQRLELIGRGLRWCESYWSDGDELVWIAAASEEESLNALEALRQYVNSQLGRKLDACVSSDIQDPNAFSESYRRASAELSRRSGQGFNKTILLGDPHALNKDTPVQRIKAYIEARYAGPVTVEELARTVFLTPNYISNLFKEQTGETIIDYLTGVRMRHARAQLADPQRKIYEIAESTGFNSTSYFSVVFKNMYGASPKEYRESLLGRAPE
ncbi:response regulator transcription factor [Cohnella sp. JJ-181]|uniref:response regulator transcription factor n=1 Tax=Cohnella rhizoplanae TaxID=2974897 RepID=UPI0022FF7295|nr:helix-turn-helix domain-containing protein [Cohnella sp. JJ-181]CAI6081215.1 HTH-type transcriptional activator RhaR [Cohnella sp. JJ-181]